MRASLHVKLEDADVIGARAERPAYAGATETLHFHFGDVTVATSPEKAAALANAILRALPARGAAANAVDGRPSRYVSGDVAREKA